MVYLAPLISAAALFAGLTSAAPRPRPDSAVGGEVAVSAPNGIPLSDTAELASQLSSESAAAAATAYPAVVTSSPSWDSMASAATAAPYMAPAAVYSSAAVYSPPPAYSAPPAYASASVSAAAAVYTTPSYGSGSSTWGSGSAYDSCVQQCVASFGAPSATMAPPSVQATGATHTVIVAPTQGVLRYVPFVVNATVGDTVNFVWMANNHTVTKSSELEICNKTSLAPFASGTQNMGFSFQQVVNDTNPTFFYCGTPTHCQKGMFGIINPPSIDNAANTSMAMMMSSLTASNPSLASAASYVNSMTAGMEAVSTWGGNVDLANFPDWSHSFVAENVLYARTFMAQNPDVVKEDGSIDLSTNAPLIWPADLSNAVAAASASASAAAPPATAAASAASAAASAAATGSSTTNGASAKVISTGLLAVVTIAGAFLAL